MTTPSNSTIDNFSSVTGSQRLANVNYVKQGGVAVGEISVNGKGQLVDSEGHLVNKAGIRIMPHS